MRSASHNASLARHYLEGGKGKDLDPDMRERLESDPDLLQALAEEVIRQQGRMALKKELVGIRKELYKGKKNRYGGQNKRIGAFSAVVLILCLLWFTIFQKDPEPVASYFEPYRSIGMLRNGVHDSTASNWEQAMQLYERKNFEQALELFDLAGMTEPVPQPQLDFYRGMCYLFQEPSNFDQARTCLLAVDTTVNNWNHQADWYLAYVHYQEGNLEESKRLFRLMVKEDNHRWGRDAQVILEDHF
ncbi:hypothetical protein KFE98_14395 [bacterium SCSIO 12741]|nr:hypothetical protein KFE98_14395 [bacterium SCSIO 12741]